MSLPPYLKVSPSFIEWSLGTNRGIMAHLYQFTQPVLGPEPLGTIWFRINGGLWNNNPLADPIANIGGFTFPTISPPLYPYIGEGTGFVGGQVLTANFGATTFVYTPPSGYSPVGAAVTWNPTDAGPSVILSDSNLAMAVGGETTGAVRGNAVLPTSSSGVYYEVTCGATIAQNIIVGVSNGLASLSPFLSGAVSGVAAIRETGSVVIDDSVFTGVFARINGGDVISIALSYNIPLAPPGPSDYFTDFDQDIVWNGQTWKANSLRFEGLQRKLSVGLAVDEQNLKIWAAPTDTMFGANFLEGVQEGLLDGVTIVRYRIIWPFVTGNVAADIQKTPLTVYPLFTGFTSTAPKGGASHVELKVKSALVRLSVNMPRNYFQPGCGYTLYDQGCTLIKSAFAVNGVIGSGATAIAIPVVGGVTPVTGADGIANFAQGRLMFTSGVNEGLQVFINTNDGVNLYLAYPLNDLPSSGDTVVFYPGCSKAFNTCKLKFNNDANFRGFDKVPPIQVSA
jgi:uncharacterized phage protein (TIGR02218 family)